MLRGRDFESALNKALEYGGKAATAYQVGKAAYVAGRFILPLILQKGMSHGIREGARPVHRTVQSMAAGVAGGAVATRGPYEKARPALMRGVDAGLSSYDAIRSAIR